MFLSYFIQPPSDTFEMEGHDSYDSTENTVWKRGNDEVGFISLQSYALISRIDQQ